MNRARLLIIAFVVIALLIVGGAFAYSRATKRSSNPIGNLQSKVSKAPPKSGLPLSPTNPNVLSVAAVYNLQGEVEKIDSSLLTLKPKGDKLPALKLTDKTPVFKVTSDRKSTTAALKDVQPGTKVTVTAAYSFATGAFQATRIVIEP